MGLGSWLWMLSWKINKRLRMNLFLKSWIILSLTILFFGCSNKTKYWLMYKDSQYLVKKEIASIIEKDEYLRKEINYSKESFWSNTTDISMINLTIGDAYYSLGEYAKSIIYFKKYIQSAFSSEVERKIFLGSIHTRIAQAYIKLGLYENAMKYLNLKEHVYSINKRTLLRLLIEINTKKNNFDKVHIYLKKLLMEEGGPDFVIKCDTYNQFGDFYIKTKEYLKAKEYLSFSLKLALSQLSDKNSEYNIYKRKYYDLKGKSAGEINFLISNPTACDARIGNELVLSASKYPYPYKEIL